MNELLGWYGYGQEATRQNGLTSQQQQQRSQQQTIVHVDTEVGGGGSASGGGRTEVSARNRQQQQRAGVRANELGGSHSPPSLSNSPQSASSPGASNENCLGG